MHRPNPFRRVAIAFLVLLTSTPLATIAAEIYVLDARIARDGRSSVSPTFIVTPGERALLSFDGERDLEVAMTVTPRSGADAAESLELKVELVEGVMLESTTVPVALARTESFELAGRTIDVLIRVQEPIGQPADAAAAADDAENTAPAAVGTGAGETGDAGGGS